MHKYIIFQLHQHSLIWHVLLFLDMLFCLLCVAGPKHPQLAFGLLTVWFDRISLETNPLKAEYTTLFPGRITSCLPKEACHTMIDPFAS